MMLKMVEKNHKQLYSIPINTKINSKNEKKHCDTKSLTFAAAFERLVFWLLFVQLAQ